MLNRHLAAAFATAMVCMTASLDAADSPLIESKAAAKNGKATYLRLCQYCHGVDGKAHENIDFQATNLTELEGWKRGTQPQQIFNSIKNGAGDDMPAFKTKATDDEIWQLVAFILSIGPEDRRPKND
ncbi:MAG TPA: cytochrome c [Steroidobacteraceae bacterium]|nr:cytochrome c [Steroidobacteraceae bacterium]